MSSVYDHPDYQHLLAAVRAAPDDDLPRLVLADWLEERIEGERAVLIRKMCEKHSRFSEFGSRDVGGGMWIWDSLKRSMPTWFKWKSTSRRVAKLALEGLHTTEWRSMSVRLHRGFISRVSGPLGSLIGGECWRCASRRRMARQIERLEGEAAGVDATGLADDLMDLHDPCPGCNGTGRTAGVLRELVRREPVRFVEVTDKEPRPNTADLRNATWWGWFLTDRPRERYDLTFNLWDHLHPRSGASEWRQYPTPDAARAALSAAILRLVQPVEVPT